MVKGIKKRFIQIAVAIGCFILSVATGFAALKKVDTVDTQADTVVYRTGANSISSTYYNSKYYRHVSSIPLTGDGVTDTLAVGLSQLGYYEGLNGYFGGDRGAQGAGGTEFVYNYGDVGEGYGMAWCASFCSWSIYQSRTANHSTHAQSCRNHIGDINYIWRECSCGQWADQLKRFDMYKSRTSGYVPKAGDLIFFKYSSGSSNWTNHIGFVLWSDGARVYTLEGNRQNHVMLDDFALSDSLICGYGVLPYPSNPNAPKVDYSGRNKTAGQYITNNATLSVSSVKGGAAAFSVGKYEMFNVTGFDSGYAVVEYNGQVGYATLNATTIQVTAKAEQTQKITVDKNVVANTAYAGGTAIPTENNNANNPNVLITGLDEDVNHYKGLENYGNNKELVLINGRTWSKWEERPGENILNNLWIRGAGNGTAYLGLDINRDDRLCVKRQGNVIGDELETIVLKRGFQFINTATDLWGGDEINNASASKVIGVLTKNIILTVNAAGGFDVIVEGDNAMRLDGYRFATAQTQVVTTTADANVRSGPSTNDTILGTATQGSSFAYLGEIQGDKWLKVDYNGQVGWISNVNASVNTLSQGVEITALNDPWLEDVEDRKYAIVRVGTYNEACGPNNIAIKFMDNVDATASNVFLDNTEWEGITDATANEFLQHVKIRRFGETVDVPASGAGLSTIARRDGLMIVGLDMSAQDQIVIEQGAVFTYNGVSMTMLHEFRFTFEGEQAQQKYTPWGITTEEKHLAVREYSIVNMSVYDGATSANQISFKFLNNAKEEYSNVYLGYNVWTEPDADTTAFMQYIKINGAPISEALALAVLKGMDQDAGLSLFLSTNVQVGDVVSIDQGAVFTHDGVTMTLPFGYAFTYNGVDYNITKYVTVTPPAAPPIIPPVEPPVEEDSSVDSASDSWVDSSETSDNESSADSSNDIASDSEVQNSSVVDNTTVKGCASVLSATGVLTVLAAAFVVVKKRKE